MRKKFSLTLLLLSIMGSRICFAQNLVYNPSFEEHHGCPSVNYTFNNVLNWYQVFASPDYYNSCANSSFPFNGVPSNFAHDNYLNAATGNAYAGFLCYGAFANHLLPESREYITGSLASPLSIGVKYYVSFKVALADYCHFAIDHIGIKFSTVLNSHSTFNISNKAQIYTNNIISDTLNWTVISGSFIADSNYQFFTIGNHFSDSKISTTIVRPDTIRGVNAYYFFDDICVSTDSLSCNSIVGVTEISNENKIKVFPNPFNSIAVLEMKEDFKNAELNIYNTLGEQVRRQKIISQTTTISRDGLTNGIYFFQVISRDGKLGTGQLIIE